MVGTSKTLRSLARICGAAPSGEGQPTARTSCAATTSPTRCPGWPEMTIQQRATLPGVSQQRARQLLAGALVADAAMDLLGTPELLLCPWALREGTILRRLDTMTVDG